MEFLIALACIAIIARFFGELMAVAFFVVIIGLALGAIAAVIGAIIWLFANPADAVEVLVFTAIVGGLITLFVLFEKWVGR